MNAANGDRNETQVKEALKGLPADLHRYGQNEPDCRRRYAVKHGRDGGPIAVQAVCHAHREHNQSTRQADTDNRDNGAWNAAQAISHKDSHVCGIQAG